MPDDRIEIPSWARSMGVFGGLLMMALGLIIAWRRSDSSAVLPQTGWKPPTPSTPPTPSSGDRLMEALIGRIEGRPPGEGKS